MAICPVCGLDKPALPFQGVCSWACKAKAPKAPTTPVKAVAPVHVPPTPAPLTLRAFFASQPPGTLVAARRQNNSNKLFFHKVAAGGSEAMRPSVYLQDYLSRNNIQVRGKVIVNYPVNSWINQNSALEQTLASQETSTLDTVVEPVAVDGQLKAWEQFSLDRLGPRPGLTSLGEATAPVSISKARRMYLLGTFCLLKKFGLMYEARTHGHNIAAMLVSGEGEVLSWGVNTGEFRHAEVNTIINYFRLNPTASRLPAKSVLFSTLKPCLMCSTLIQSTWHTDGEPRVWYGMMDEGGSGSTTLLGEWSNGFKAADVELDVFELLSPEGTLDSATRTSGTKPVRVVHNGLKGDLYDKLTSSGGKSRKMSAADWVDKSKEVLELIDAAQATFIAKSNKPRDDGPAKKVLAHLKPFVT